MADRPILDKLKNRRPLIGGVVDFFANYSRKATVNSVAGTAVTTLLLQQLGIDGDAASGILGWLAALPWYVQAPALLVGYFALVWFPANKTTPEPGR